MQPTGVGSAQWILPLPVRRPTRDTGPSATLARASALDRPARRPARHGRAAAAGALAFALLCLAPLSVSAQAPAPDASTRFAAAQAQPSRGWLTPRRVDTVKAVVATAGAALLLFGVALRRIGTPDAHRRVRDAALLTLGLVAAACWWNLSALHYSHYLHRADQYLYFTGSKYFAELGYDRLYRCTAVAEAEDGRADAVAKRFMRDTEVNRLVRGATALESPEACKAHFTPERWQAFRADVRWFRDRLPPRQWRLTQIDHGYNATPAWSILAVTLANTGPASDARILTLALIDPALLLAMWGAVCWAFGWRAACVAALFWGTSYPSVFGWTGGAYLRQDWLAASIVSLCLLRKERPAAAGFLLVCAALLRVFPALIGVGLGLKAATSLGRRRTLRLEPAHARFAAGAGAALVLVLPLSVATTGIDAWPDFVENSRVHLDTPLQNYLGLKTVLSYDHSVRSRFAKDASAEDPWAAWKQARREAFEGRGWLFVGAVLAYLALLARAVSQQEDWVAAALGIGLIPIAAELTGYYYAVLLGMGLLWTRRESVGAALCGLSALGWGIANRWHFYDEIYTWISLAAVAFVLLATAVFLAKPGERSGA